MQILPLISTLLIVLSAILVAIGWVLIKRGKREAHKKVMISAVISAASFLVIYLSRTIFIGNTSFGGPENIKIYYTIFLLCHIIFSIVSAVFGIIVLRHGLKENFEKHKKLAPVTSIMWFITATSGVVVYLLLYVIYEGGETTSMIRAILGY
jgi:putative membrane protein